MQTRLRILCVVTAGICASAFADETNVVQHVTSSLAEMSLEDLMNIEVTSVSKRPEKLSETAAAVFVITQEDFRRSGATTIAEALRMSPGVEVAEINSHIWAVTVRGFNDQFANKLLVLMDGRSVYTPLFAGTFWDVQDTLLEDVDRIEVIRGPGGTLWGANAVNGVINIITKSARDTQGWLVTGGGGTEERGFGSVRYGGKLGENAWFRAYVKYFNRDDTVSTNGMDNGDSWYATRGGFRVDWEASQDNLITFQGDMYGGGVHTGIDFSGGNVLGRWSHDFANGSDMKLQLDYDHTHRKETIGEDRDTFDVDFDHHMTLGRRHEILWGLGYRLTSDDIGSGSSALGTTASFVPGSRTTQVFSGFVQNEITLVEKRLNLTVGSKLEHNDYTGFEAQPSGRLLWTPQERHAIWAAVSRAVRTPSRAEDDILLNQVAGPGPVFVQLRGDRDFDAENVIAYELGYRVGFTDWLSLDVATYYNDYGSLRSFEPAPTTLPVVAAATLGNNLSGEGYGVETAVSCQPTDRWRLVLTYTYLQLQLHKESGTGGSFVDGTQLDPENQEGNSPHNQFGLRSLMNLPGKVELDSGLRFVDSLANLNVPSYWSLDVRLSWKPRENLELAVVGQNLLDDRHLEFLPTFIRFEPAEIQHGVYGKVTWVY